MSSNSIRHKFIEKFGKEKYKEFVLSLYESFPLRNKLFFWQEQLLKDLNMQQIELKEVYSIFNHCPIHDDELNKDNVPTINGNLYIDNISLNEEKKLFPLANVHALRNLDNFEYPECLEILFCPSCREERSKHKSER